MLYHILSTMRIEEEVIMAIFRATRDEVRERVQDLIAHLMQEQQGTGT